MNDAIRHLECFGYCLLENAIPRTEALALGERCLEQIGRAHV